MSELVRPTPRPSAGQRLAGRVRPLVAGTTPARVLTGAGALLLVAVASWWLLRTPAPPVEQALPRASVPAAAPSSRLSAPTDTPAALVVQIAGAVARPGVYHLPDPSRVDDLLARAGGPTADADSTALNLAARLADGERVYVPRLGEATAALTVTSAPSAAGAPLDLNAATLEQLDALPGVGPTTAQAIVTRRERNGPFTSVDDLLDVPGIGPAKLDALRDLVRV